MNNNTTAAGTAVSTALLSVTSLNIVFNTYDGKVTAVNDLNLHLAAGKTLGLVGESGSGKTQIGLAILGLTAANAEVRGSIVFAGRQILHLAAKEMNRLRSREIAMIFQDPMTALNPYLTIGTQLTEVLRYHRHLSYGSAYRQALLMLDAVKISKAAQRMRQYPHEFSGGMRQRVAIAMAVLCQPRLLIADEPTTALDVTVQADILALLRELCREFNMTLLFISHDLGVVNELCDQIMVMRRGEAVESGSCAEIFSHPRAAYTRNLLTAIPKLPEGTYAGG